MTDRTQRDDEEPLAMPRAEESMYIQDQDTAPPPPADAVPAGADEPLVLGQVSFEEAPPASRARGVLKLAAALLAVVAVMLFFLPAFTDALQRGGAPVKVPKPAPKVGDQVTVVMLVDSTPSAADVVVDGTDRGQTPTGFHHQCRLGAPVIVRVSRPGYKPVEKERMCRIDDSAPMSVKVTLKRRRAANK